MEFGNNNFVGFNQPTMGTGYQWNPNPAQQTKQMNVLTADEIQTLMKQENKFTLALTQTEKLKAACNHRRADGMGDTLVENADGTVSCQICGYTFKPVDPATSGEEYLNGAVDEIVDILQTIKMLWIDVDPQVLREYTQIIPLIEKVPQLYSIAAKNYSNHENANSWSYANRNMGTLQMFQLLNGVMNQAGQPNQMQFTQQPVMNQGYYQQPIQPQPMMQNPFGGYGQAPMTGYAPQMNGYAYTPTPQPQQAPVVDPAATVAPAATPEAPKAEETTTSATFKA